MHCSFVKLLPLFFIINLNLFAQAPAPDSLNFKSDSLAHTYLHAAKRYLSKSQTTSGFKELLKAEVLYKKTGNKTGEALVWSAFGEFYENHKLWADSEMYYQKAFSSADQKDSTGTTAGIAFRLAGTLYQQGKYDQALKYNTFALDHFTIMTAKGKMAECYIQLASIKRKQGNYALAENLLIRQVLPLLRSAGDEYGRIKCFDMLGHVYHDQKRYSEAKWFFIQANTQSRKLKDTVGIITSLINLSKVKINIKDYNLAIRDLKEAETLSLRKNLLLLLTDVKNAYGTVYQKTGNKKASVKYTSEYQVLKDSISHLQTNTKIQSSKAKREAEIQLIPSPQVAKWPAKNNSLLYFLSGIIVLLAIAGILLFFWVRKK